MGTNKTNKEKKPVVVTDDFIDHFWKKSWTYIKTVVDVVREPILILDEDFRVIAANEPFYRVFQVNEKDTNKKIIYELGNGQWNIPALRKLLEDILPKDTFFKGFEVSHEFPLIGHKTMILNARQIFVEDNRDFPPIILLAIEDITEMLDLADVLVRYTEQLEEKTEKRIKKMESQIKKMDKKS